MEAQARNGISFDLENDSAISEKRVKVGEGDSAFRVKCQLCVAGGDWQVGVYYFRCQLYEGYIDGLYGEKMFVLIPDIKQGNSHLAKTDDGKGWTAPNNGEKNTPEMPDETRSWEHIEELIIVHKNLMETEMKERHGRVSKCVEDWWRRLNEHSR